MSRYVDAYVTPVPTARLDEYRKIAELCASIWREHGALEYHEWIADDVQPGKQTSFPQSVDLKPGETVVIAYIVFNSREDRDRVNEQVIKDPRMDKHDPKDMPFDGLRMFWGGFKSLVEV